MRHLDDLRRELQRIDGRGYPAYKGLRGEYDADGFLLVVEHVQGDPFAEPSRLRVELSPAQAALPAWALATPARRVACADFLNRALAAALERHSGRTGSGRSGELRVLRPSQAVLARTSLQVAAGGAVVARIAAGLPAQGRRVLGRRAAELLGEAIPAAVAAALVFGALDAAALRRHLETVEDAQALRAQLAGRELVAFVADGAVLPRRSGVDDRPLRGEAVVPFRAPDELAVTLEAPGAGRLRGLGLPRGVTVVVGGGFHGKSTLLRALERGVYDHVPGDGREQVVTDAAAVKVRAEDGRAVAGVDIRNFIGDLPGGDAAGTRAFSTPNASGSTSQAAAVVEALQLGATCLLVDEDTSATNFMIRDARMQALIPDELEPITPYIDRARELADRGVSTVLVVGGSGDPFDVADTVIAMQRYRPVAVTARAREVAAQLPTRRRTGAPRPWVEPARRLPDPGSIDPSHGRRDARIKLVQDDRLLFGAEEVNAGAVEQLVEAAQLRAIAHALAWARGGPLDGRRSLAEACQAIEVALAKDGLDAVQPRPTGTLAAFRRFELAAVLDRLRSLRVRPAPPAGP